MVMNCRNVASLYYYYKCVSTLWGKMSDTKGFAKKLVCSNSERYFYI